MVLQTTTYRVSWYGGHHHGRRTASGELFDKNNLTAASPLDRQGKPVYRLNSQLEVTNSNNGKSVVVRVNDTGGFAKHGRQLDLSEGAFRKIASVNQGVIKVFIKKL